MSSTLWTWAPYNWVHALLVVAIAILGGRAARPAVLLGGIALGAVLAPVLSLALYSGRLGALRIHYSGHLAAALLAGVLPLALAGFAGRSGWVQERSFGVRVGVGILAGAAGVIMMPALQLALGCLLTPVCL